MTTNSLSTTSLQEVSFIGGSYKELIFDVYDEYKTPIDISSASCAWVLSPFGQPDYVALTKTGVYDTSASSKNRFKVYLYSSDTSGISGKYVQQPVVTMADGYEFRVGQGYIYITPSNTQTTLTNTNSTIEEMSSLLSELSGSIVKAETGASIAVSSASATVSNGVYTGFNAASVQYDNISAFTGSTGSNIVIPKTGVYIIQVVGGFTANATGVRGVVSYVNGVWNESLFVNALSGIHTYAYMTLVTKRNQGETMQFAYYQTSGGNLNATCKLGIALVKDLS